MAKHILGIGNSLGGCIIIGILQKDDNSFEPVGLDTLIDKEKIVKSLRKYLPSELLYDVLDFAYDESEYSKIKGKKFQILVIENNSKAVPFISMAEGEGIRSNAIYVRRQGQTVEADYTELQELLNRRVETQYSSKGENAVQTAVGELKALYQSIPKTIFAFGIIGENSPLFASNPDYPDESFEDFVKKMIEIKKKQIAQLLGVLVSV